MATSLSSFTTGGQNTIRIFGGLFKSAGTLDLITIGGPIATTTQGRADLANVLFAYYGAAPASVLANYPTYTGYASTSTSAQFAATLIDTMTFGTSISTATKDAWKAIVVAALPSFSSRGAAAIALMDLIDTYTGTDVDIMAANNVLDNRTETAAGFALGTTGLTFTSLLNLVTPVAAVTDVSTSIPPATGTLFTLTTGVDSVTGTAGTDTVNGVVSSTTTSSTLSAGDNIAASTGTDTLNIIFDGTTPAYTPTATITGVEVVNLKNVATGTATANLIGIAGITDISNDGGLAAMTVTGLDSNAAVTVKNTAATLNLTYSNTVLAGASDTVNITLSAAASGSSVKLGATSGTEGVETVTITSSGAANTLSSITSDQDDFVTLNLKGDKALTLSAVDSTLTTISATGMTAGLTATISAATTANNVTFTGTGLNDTITTATTTNLDILDGGAGTDTLVATGTFAAALTNFEALTVTNGATSATSSVTLTDAQAITAVTVNSTIAQTAFTIAGAGATIAATYNNNTNSGALGASTFNLKTNTGGSDAVTLNFTGNGTITQAAAAWTFGGGTATTGIETVNLSSTTLLTLWNNADPFISANLQTVTYTGAGGFTAAGGIAAAGNAAGFNKFDASTATGAITLGAAPSANAMTILGGSNNDSLIGGAAADTITGGAGNDSITGAAGADTIDGGAGIDSIVNGAGNDKMTGGAGADTYTVIGVATNSTVASAHTLANPIANTNTITFGSGVDVITDFASGTDKLDVPTAATAPTTAIGVNPGAAGTTDVVYSLLGTYDSTTGVFTVNSAATSATTGVAMAINVGDGTLTQINHTGWVVLTGIASLAAADFI